MGRMVREIATIQRTDNEMATVMDGGGRRDGKNENDDVDGSDSINTNGHKMLAESPKFNRVSVKIRLITWF